MSAPMNEEYGSVGIGFLDDGFGNLWERCGDACDLEIVRPGKVQCSGQACGVNEEDNFRAGWDESD